jgi:hypothetical protein
VHVERAPPVLHREQQACSVIRLPSPVLMVSASARPQ